ncbi:MAG: ABC transporter ATP-binding protein [Actinomycetes bacterium]
MSQGPINRSEELEEIGERMSARVVIDRVSHDFGNGVQALSEVDLSFQPGEFVSIVGPSGCGKSTLFNIVSGLLYPTRGRVLITGKDVTGETGHVGYMLQKDLLVPWRTVLGNITLGSALCGRVTAEERLEARELATRYGLGSFLRHYPHALSGGMRQRVALMRTLAVHADVLILDEPFGALDSQTRFDMQQWLLGVWGDTESTVLFVTHDVDESIFLSDRVLVMTGRPGSIAADIRTDLPRPRDLDVLTSPAFVEIKRGVVSLLHNTGTRHAEEAAAS